MSGDLSSKYVLISRDTANLIRGAFIPDNPRRMRTAHPDVRRAAEEFIAALAPGASSPPSDALITLSMMVGSEKIAESFDSVASYRKFVLQAIRDLQDRGSETKSERPYGCIHDSSPTTWCGVCYPEKCTATETGAVQDTDKLAWCVRVHEDLALYIQDGVGNMIYTRAHRALGIMFDELQKLEKVAYPDLLPQTETEP